jgi:SNF2 family DNA or RNA helicase
VLSHRSSLPDRAVRIHQRDRIDQTDLFPHVIEGARFLRAHDRCLLADEMGVGKTVQTLAAFERHVRAIVICPASVCLQWAAERAKWRPDLGASIGGALRRPEEGEMLIYSGDALPEPPRRSEVLVRGSMRGVTLVVDEAQMFKAASAERTQRLRRLARQVDRVWLLTGTPMLGIPTDLYGVLESGGLEHVFESEEAFIALCGGQLVRGRGGEAYEWGDVSPAVRAALEPIMLRRTRKQVLPNLPERQYVDIPVPAPPDFRQHKDAAQARRELAISRIPAALDWARHCASSIPLLVFSVHREPVLAMAELEGAGVFTGTTPRDERARIVDAFQRGELRILAMTLDAGGTGLNLTAAGAELFIDRDFTPGVNEQAETRPLRTGQQHQSILIARMMCDHPLDRRREASLREKARLIAAVVG